MLSIAKKQGEERDPLPGDDRGAGSKKKLSAVRCFWEWWKRVGKKIGDFQARVLLSFFYYTVFAPFAIAVRWVSDPLAIKDGAPRGWQLKREGEASPTERATRQF